MSHLLRPRAASPRRPPVLLLAVGVAAVSTSAILVRVAEAPALALAFWRTALGAAVLLPLAVRSPVRLQPAQWGSLVAAGAALAVHFALFIGSLSYTTVASAVILVSTSPVIVGLLSAVRRIDSPTPRAWGGIAIGTAGAAVVTLADRGTALTPAPLLGNLMALGGAVTVALYLLIGREMRRTLPVTVYASAVYGIAAILLLIASLVTATSLGFSRPWPASTWWAIVGLTAGPQLLGHTVFNALLARVSATVVALVTLAEPLGSTVLAAVLLDELPTWGFYLGAPVIVAGVWLGVANHRADARRGSGPPAGGDSTAL